MGAIPMLGKPVVDEMMGKLETEGPAHLGIVVAGDRPESASYIKQVEKTAARLNNLRLTVHRLAESVTLEELHSLLAHLNGDRDVSGYMVQLPLPPHLQAHVHDIRGSIASEKDVDLIGYAQRGILASGKREGQLVPPTPYAVMKMLKHYGCDVRGKMMAIVGDGEVGSRLKVMAGNDKCAQIVLNETTANIGLWTRDADIVVGASGVPDVVVPDMVRPGALVVNVGMKFEGGKMKGDIRDDVAERASMMTPVMGGLGPVTVAALIQNTFRAERLRKTTS